MAGSPYPPHTDARMDGKSPARQLQLQRCGTISAHTETHTHKDTHTPLNLALHSTCKPFCACNSQQPGAGPISVPPVPIPCHSLVKPCSATPIHAFPLLKALQLLILQPGTRHLPGYVSSAVHGTTAACASTQQRIHLSSSPSAPKTHHTMPLPAIHACWGTMLICCCLLRPTDAPAVDQPSITSKLLP